ncbi:MAG: 50S ribosomal protein L24 [bacterium]|nr:50S ribosomal protein L24 [bacterium]
MKIKKGDNVIVIAGKDRGTQGVVERAFPQREQVLIAGVNMKKRHRRAQKNREVGSIVEVAAPIHVSNVQLFDSSSKKAVRVGYTIEGKKKTRISKASGKAM